jgi:phage/plasmid-like protein (TIGR03299 family)
MVAAVETMAYVQDRGTPWHGLGTPVPGLMTAAEAIEASGLDWDVAIRNNKIEGGEIYPDRWGTVRVSDGQPLGIVGRRYQVIQNRAAFAFADNLVDDGQAKYETAGSLWNGKRIFLSMELGHLDITVKGDDSDTKMYLMLTNSHDSATAAEGVITPVRTVCQNTLNLALASAKASFKIRHTGDITAKLLQAREALGISFKYAEDFGRLAQRLALKKVTDKQILEILRTAVFPIDEDAVSEERLAEHSSTLAFENYLHSDNLATVRGTAWGAINGIAEFIDYGVEYRGQNNSAEDVRTNSLLWGTGQDKKQRALKALTAL